MKRATIPALVVVVAALVLADLLVVNASLSGLAGIVIDAAILVAAGAALAAAASLGFRRASDVWLRRGDPVGAIFVLVGLAAMLIAGLRPGATGTDDPAVSWLVAALLIPLGATLFGLLFVTTLAAARRSVASGGRQGLVVVGAAAIVLVLLLPIGGGLEGWLAATAALVLDGPIGAAFRGLLIGVAIVGAVVAARTMLGVGSADE